MLSKCNFILALSLMLSSSAIASNTQAVCDIAKLNAKLSVWSNVNDEHTKEKAVFNHENANLTAQNTATWYEFNGMINLGPLNTHISLDEIKRFSMNQRAFIWQDSDDKTAGLSMLNSDTNPPTHGEAVDSVEGNGEFDDNINHHFIAFHTNNNTTHKS